MKVLKSILTLIALMNFTSAFANSGAKECRMAFNEAKAICKSSFDRKTQRIEFLVCKADARDVKMACLRDNAEKRRLCNADFRANIFACGDLEASLQGACIKDARGVRHDCIHAPTVDPVAQCKAECDDKLQQDNLTCEQTYDPATCGGDLRCESNELDLQNACKAAATDDHLTCTQACDAL